MEGESQTSECKGNDYTVVRVLHTFIYKTAIYNMYKDLSLGVKQILELCTNWETLDARKFKLKNMCSIYIQILKNTKHCDYTTV